MWKSGKLETELRGRDWPSRSSRDIDWECLGGNAVGLATAATKGIGFPHVARCEILMVFVSLVDEAVVR